MNYPAASCEELDPQRLIMLSEQAIEEFKIIYRTQYGKELSFADATKHANSLIRLYKAVLSPLCNEASQNSNANIRDST
ncbi:MAG: hypothetical protein ACUZ8N_08385 [Candidatus Scalindua sp.]